jgi:hypothetical protein
VDFGINERNGVAAMYVGGESDSFPSAEEIRISNFVESKYFNLFVIAIICLLLLSETLYKSFA